MGIEPRPGMVRFWGSVDVFSVAICHECDMALPFPDPATRMQWALEHPHGVTFAVDVRPDASMTENKRQELIAKLREKYTNPMPAGRIGSCAGEKCNGHITPYQRYIQWNGKLWHAECLDDFSYLRMASIQDFAPGLFNQVKPVEHRTWLPNDPIVSGSAPKKLNARERRRQKREGKQWTK